MLPVRFGSHGDGARGRRGTNAGNVVRTHSERLRGTALAYAVNSVALSALHTQSTFATSLPQRRIERKLSCVWHSPSL